MRTIKTIIIHCAETPTGKHFTVEDIDSWHVERGFKRDDAARLAFNYPLKAVGYHFIIYIDGSVHTGRQVSEVGAHCAGMNSDSIGICLIGKGEYTSAQWVALDDLIKRLYLTFKDLTIKGHYECPTGIAQGKTCPNFDIPKWVATGTPSPENVC